MTIRVVWLAISLALPAIVAGCGREGQAAQPANAPANALANAPANGPAELRTVPVTPPATATVTPVAGAPVSADRRRQSAAQVSSGSAPELVAHPENIQAGLPAQQPLRALSNPREHDPRAIEEGKQLFVSYNCADCHGGEGSGGMGPSLQDGRWHFGGTPGEVYESISEGRPDGMPSWGGRINDSQIWALVAYVRTLSSGKDVTTQTFEGAGTVERGGH
jgi:cytochrome c oxidase cbb3-type subunit III